MFSSFESRDTDGTSSQLTTAPLDPSAPTELQRYNAYSYNAEAGDWQPVKVAAVDLSWVNWNRERLAGFYKPISWLNHQLSAWWWQFGGVIEEGATQLRYWLCKECYLNDRDCRHQYRTDKGGLNIKRHLLEYHRRVEEGILAPGSKRRRLDISLIDRLGLNANNLSDQAVINKLATTYDHQAFRRLLVQWLVYDNIPFYQVESQRFNKLLTYLQPRVASSVPCYLSARRWVMRDYYLLKRGVIKELRAAPGRIYIAFDLWTSKSLLSLNGIVVHFINAQNKPKTFLLALPEQLDSHTGINLAGTVLEIIEEY